MSLFFLAPRSPANPAPNNQIAAGIGTVVVATVNTGLKPISRITPSPKVVLIWLDESISAKGSAEPGNRLEANGSKEIAEMIMFFGKLKSK